MVHCKYLVACHIKLDAKTAQINDQNFDCPNSWPPMTISPFANFDVQGMDVSDFCGVSFPAPYSQDSESWSSHDILSTTTNTAASSPATWISSTSEPSSPDFTKAAMAPQSQRDSKASLSDAQALKADQEAISAKLLSRKAQNRAAQQAHRERKKKLIEELWGEIHSLRGQNAQLRRQLQTKTEMLQSVCEQLQGDRSN